MLKENIRYRVYYLRAGPRKNLPMYPQVVAGMAFSETCFFVAENAIRKYARVNTSPLPISNLPKLYPPTDFTPHLCWFKCDKPFTYHIAKKYSLM